MAVIQRRIANERSATDEGRVYEQHGKLRARFRHADQCPNHLRGDAFLDVWCRRVVPGSDVLDVGCNEGHTTLRYWRLGARRIVGIDISPVGIEKARALGNFAEFHVRDAHNTGFPDCSFDAVLGVAVLHHLDYETAIREIHRILKPGGYAVFREPLRDNPAGKLIRLLTRGARTADELPLSRRQIQWANELFTANHHGFFGLTSTGVALCTSLLLSKRSADNRLLRAADKFDVAVAKTPLRYWMRTVVLVWRK